MSCAKEVLGVLLISVGAIINWNSVWYIGIPINILMTTPGIILLKYNTHHALGENNE